MDVLLQPPAETSAPEVSDTVVNLRVTTNPGGLTLQSTATRLTNTLQ